MVLVERTYFYLQVIIDVSHLCVVGWHIEQKPPRCSTPRFDDARKARGKLYTYRQRFVSKI